MCHSIKSQYLISFPDQWNDISVEIAAGGFKPMEDQYSVWCRMIEPISFDRISVLLETQFLSFIENGWDLFIWFSKRAAEQIKGLFCCFLLRYHSDQVQFGA